MTPESPPPPIGDLPPVEPPSARFIMQLFVIPFLIVVILICFLLLVYVLFGRIAGGGQDASGYVRAIRSENPNRRWRAAYELASLIHNDARLAQDPTLLGELTTLLNEELARPKAQGRVEVPQYLALAIGSFETLEAQGPDGPIDPLESLAQALGPDYPAEVRVAAATSLSRQADRLEGRLEAPEVVKALIQACQAEDPEVRHRAAYALGYFDQPNAHQALRDRVTRDEDRIVRYNAAVALARLDDPAGLPVLREMLSQADLEAAFAGQLREEPDVARSRFEAIQFEVLLTLQSALRADKVNVASQLHPELQAIEATASPPLRLEARSILKTLPSPD